jgi:hypothetical protein
MSTTLPAGASGESVTTQNAGERLYALLPSVHRIQDAMQPGQPLRALLAVVGEQMGLVEADIERLYDNWFIETCDEWVVPYIGDLLGVGNLLSVTGGALTQRAYVANTVAYRRRKGTTIVLEQLARDVTGWPAAAVEAFELVGWTQNLNHLRPDRGGLARISGTPYAGPSVASSLELVGTAFERVAHTAEVRHVDNGRGRYDIPYIAIFLWRLQRYAIANATARAVGSDGRFTFNPLGIDTALFNAPRTEADITHRATESNVPAPLRARALYDELATRGDTTQRAVDEITSTYFDDPPVLQIFVDGVAIAPSQLSICDLRDPDPAIPEGWPRPADLPAAEQPPRPDSVHVSVDPRVGRIAFANDAVGTVLTSNTVVEVSYSYGFPGDLGGGPYDRRDSAAKAFPTVDTAQRWQIGVTRDVATLAADQASPVPRLFGSLTEASAAWDQAVADWRAGPMDHDLEGLVVVIDSRTYEESVNFTVPERCRLVVLAADWPDEDFPDMPGQRWRVPGHESAVARRPHVRGSMVVKGTGPAGSALLGAFVLDGLLVEGTLRVAAGNLGELRVAHSTLVPGAAAISLDVEAGNDYLDLTLERTISGPVRIAADARALRVTEGIVDAGGDDAQAIDATGVRGSLDSATIRGESALRSLDASNCIFTGRMIVERRQMGCVRFSFVSLDSLVPRRFQCHPVDATEARRVAPSFTSVRYGTPAYMQLDSASVAEIAAGADDEGEIGAFHFLQQPQRLANARAALSDYLRLGLELGVFLAT